MKTKIFKLFSPSHPEAGVFIGSTTQWITLQALLNDYRKFYKMFKEGDYHDMGSNKVAQYEDLMIEVLETTNNGKERKAQIIHETPNCINKIKHLTKEEKKQKRRQYDALNREKINEKSRQNYRTRKEKLQAQK